MKFRESWKLLIIVFVRTSFICILYYLFFIICIYLFYVLFIFYYFIILFEIVTTRRLLQNPGGSVELTRK